DAGADAILLDNLPPATVRRLLRRLEAEGRRRRVWVELSGGITLRNLPRYARTGADAVSMGSLTHSARALPFHLVLRRPSAPGPA
ncbi:MAG TPA: carboxylating.nicotinate-nucleotide diphosphorylase, partial [Thermoplasmata archaeon]|nr:carboxylating.nicotinate-nucleotide diphosphorylase [Thermoplasmata archaeon]